MKVISDLSLECRKKIDIELRVEDLEWHKKQKSLMIKMKSLLILVLDLIFSDLAIYKKIDLGFRVSFLLSSSNKLKELNFCFRGKNKATDILSFPYLNFDFCRNEDGDLELQKWSEYSDLVLGAIGDRYVYLGDIALSYQALDEARLNLPHKNFEQHFSHIIIHGILHLLGFEHDNEEKAFIMENLEVKIMKILGYESPYSYNG